MNLWDKKASKYPRYKENKSEFEQQFYDSVAKFGISFKDKNIIDIGCGTGVHSLRLAKLAKKLFGVDSSQAMLDILNDDAKRLGLNNVSSIKASWSELDLEQIRLKSALDKFDIAFCTMSPALSSDADFCKFIDIADSHIYLGWAKPRSSDVLEYVFSHFKKPKQKEILASKRLQSYLKRNNINYHFSLLSEDRVALRNAKELYENVCWHLEINQIKFNPSEVQALLDQRYKDECIEEKISSLMLLLVF